MGDSARVLRLGRASAHLGSNLEISCLFLVLVQFEWWYRSRLLLLARDLLKLLRSNALNGLELFKRLRSNLTAID